MKLLNTYHHNNPKHSVIYIPTGVKPYLTRYALTYRCTTKKLMCSVLSNSELLLRIPIPEYNLVKTTKQDSF